jgi:hypothetical protein
MLLFECIRYSLNAVGGRKQRTRLHQGAVYKQGRAITSVLKELNLDATTTVQDAGFSSGYTTIRFTDRSVLQSHETGKPFAYSQVYILMLSKSDVAPSGYRCSMANMVDILRI